MMTMTNTLGDQTLAYGRRTFPETAAAVWGARLIAPNDLVPDRQDLIAVDDDAKGKLIGWINGSPEGTGAIQKAREKLAELYLPGNSNDEVVIYEDEQGKIVGSPQGSFGYVYVAGWLK